MVVVVAGWWSWLGRKARKNKMKSVQIKINAFNIKKVTLEFCERKKNSL